MAMHIPRHSASGQPDASALGQEANGAVFVHQWEQAAEHHAQNGSWPEVIQYCNQILEIPGQSKTNWKSLYLIGVAYTRLGREFEAFINLVAARDINPHHQGIVESINALNLEQKHELAPGPSAVPGQLPQSGGAAGNNANNAYGLYSMQPDNYGPKVQNINQAQRMNFHPITAYGSITSAANSAHTMAVYGNPSTFVPILAHQTSAFNTHPQNVNIPTSGLNRAPTGHELQQQHNPTDNTVQGKKQSPIELNSDSDSESVNLSSNIHVPIEQQQLQLHFDNQHQLQQQECQQLDQNDQLQDEEDDELDKEIAECEGRIAEIQTLIDECQSRVALLRSLKILRRQSGHSDTGA
jgi:hypothetical protein